MRAEEARFVWLMVFFDLPVGTKPQRRDATRFRNFLKDDGYLMLQYSVYARVCRAEEASDKHVRRVVKNLPSSGSVRAMQVTDRQFGRCAFFSAKRRNPNKWPPARWFCCEF